MSRLIDADKLIKDIIGICKCQPYLEGMQKETVYIKDVIEQQPTAFDVDRVVEQLEKQVYEIDDSLSLSARDVIDEEDVFEIVKAGGIGEQKNLS